MENTNGLKPDSSSDDINAAGSDRLPKDMKDISYDSYNLSKVIEKTFFDIGESEIVKFKMIKTDSIDKEFENMKSITDGSELHEAELYSEGGALDRYGDIMPYRHNRIQINGTCYINASMINTPVEKTFIATQGPKQHTVSDFWQMVYENEVVLIIMVCNLIEKKFSKCHKYWCPKEKIENFTLTSVSEKEIDSNLIEREFKLTHNKINETRIVKQLHFIGWPDHGCPELNEVYNSFHYMFKEVDNAKSKSKGPIVVHCSAGVGRTGTFMSIYNLHYTVSKQLEKGQTSVKFSVWNTVRKLKEQRRQSVENILQYKFIYSFMTKYLHNVIK